MPSSEEKTLAGHVANDASLRPSQNYKQFCLDASGNYNPPASSNPPIRKKHRHDKGYNISKP